MIAGKDDQPKGSIRIRGAGYANGTIALVKREGKSSGTAEANARLIAGAPDLLSALKRMTALMANTWPVDEAHDALVEAEAATAKAEGRS